MSAVAAAIGYFVVVFLAFALIAQFILRRMDVK